MSTKMASILVVDDNPNNLRVLEGMLAGAGFRILPAMNGEAALRAAKMALPDVVLLDVRMPGMDGYEVCRRLKNDASTRDVPVIFISALQDTEDKLQAFRAGGVDYITKPFHQEEVLSRVRTHVELSRSRIQLYESNQNLEAVVAARTQALTESNARLELAMKHEQALRQLLSLSHSAVDIVEYLNLGLKLLADVFGWCEPTHRTAVFLTRNRGDSGQMDMVAHIGITTDQYNYCAHINFQDCLCGESARLQRIINIDHCPTIEHGDYVIQDKEIRHARSPHLNPLPEGEESNECLREFHVDLCFPDQSPRGRIALPLISGGKTLGILMHSIAGNARIPEEERLRLEQVADVLSMSIAWRYANERIAYMAYHDELTGLMNSTAMSERLFEELQRSDRHANGFAVLFIDLDHFKQINDVLGHDAGDHYLKISSNRLQDVLPAGDVLCRWGSDEFIILALDLGDSLEQVMIETQALAIKVAEVLAQPVSVAGQEVQLNACIGIALHPGDGVNAAELVQYAELAMSRAKQAGRNLIHFYRPEMQGEAVRRMTLARELRHAISHRQFILYYQPQVDFNGRLVGVEALIRWQHPTRGLVSPLEFIPLAEELGLIVPLGEWVLEESVSWLADILTDHPAFPRLSVNVSARQFYEEDFTGHCLAILERAGISPASIELEVTESVLLANIDASRQKIEILREAGFYFAVDDFGTGYSSLAYLKSLPVQKLKIDRSFVQDVHLDQRNAAIVRTIITLAKNLAMDTIAEGVEQREEVEFLQKSGCDSYQGFYFGKPVAGVDFRRIWLAQK
jgi:diguanylate cyclase (GGDEF)-like protein